MPSAPPPSSVFATVMHFTISARGKPNGVPMPVFLTGSFGGIPLDQIDGVFGFVERSSLYGGRIFASIEHGWPFAATALLAIRAALACGTILYEGTLRAGRSIQMRIDVLAVIAGVSSIAGCAHHGMDHGSMSHEEMMRHCQMMAEHGGEAGHDPSHRDPARHGGMSHEEMQRHCEAMRAQDQQTPQQH